MTLRHKVIVLLCGIHLALVLGGAFRLEFLDGQTNVGHGLRLIRAYSGSDVNFGFFAPGVSDELRAVFVLVDAKGHTWEDRLDSQMSREAQLRVGTGVSLTGEFPDLMPLFAQSWAATMFGRHPTAVTVRVRIEGQSVPTMQQYRQGDRPQWHLISQCEFDRESPLPKK